MESSLFTETQYHSLYLLQVCLSITISFAIQTFTQTPLLKYRKRTGYVKFSASGFLAICCKIDFPKKSYMIFENKNDSLISNI